MFAFGQPILLAIVAPEHKHKFDFKNDISIYVGQPEGQVNAHYIWLPYGRRLIDRSGATKLSITRSQYDQYYSRQSQMS
jgi:hypothetical protein